MFRSTRSLDRTANLIRQDIIKMLLSAESGHSAGPLGMADVFTALYFGGVAKLDPKKRKDPARDRVVLSNAHICPVLYATLAHRGYFPIKELQTLRKIGTRLQGHSNSHFDIGIETSGGPLGQGLSQAVGMAIAARMDQPKGGRAYHTWCLMSDGELDEGQSWEAFMLAGKSDLHELTVLIDRNNIQIDGPTEEVMPLEDLEEKLNAFNWFTINVDGHNIPEILNAMKKVRALHANPTAIICHTIPGRGVDFMEGDYTWHGKPPNKEEAKLALHELRTLQGRITSEHE